jgi:hypothetical protein
MPAIRRLTKDLFFGLFQVLVASHLFSAVSYFTYITLQPTLTRNLEMGGEERGGEAHLQWRDSNGGGERQRSETFDFTHAQVLVGNAIQRGFKSAQDDQSGKAQGLDLPDLRIM